jgi:hypothetical protein
VLPKLDKDTARKKMLQADILMNGDAKILNKILAN